MAPIISEKFRIFNAKQFVECLSETPGTSYMYFFVGRPQAWLTYIEVQNVTGTFDLTTNENISGTGFVSAKIREVLPVGATAAQVKAILVSDFTPTNGTPTPGSTITGATSGATAVVGETFRYGTEDSPLVPYDSQQEKYEVYADLIAAKRILPEQVKHVIRRYTWASYAGSNGIGTNPAQDIGDFDMWRPDYSAKRPGKTKATSISTARFFTINERYQVFICLYNSEDKWLATPQVEIYSTLQPDTSLPEYDEVTGLFKQVNGTTGQLEYLWRYYYTLSQSSLQKFLSSDFMPIEPYAMQADGLIDTAGVNIPLLSDFTFDGKIYALLVKNKGTGFGLTANAIRYTPIYGDGTGGVAKLVFDATGASIAHAEVAARGSGYTYASLRFETGLTNLYTSFTPTGTDGEGGTVGGTSAAAAGKADVEVVIPVQGGHGVDLVEELNGKRIMANIRLTYAEGDGDFPVDNDFRRIGIMRDPRDKDGNLLTADTVSNLKAIYVTLNAANSNFSVDEEIEQVQGSNFARGRVVSWKRFDSTHGWLKYVQTPELHTNNGSVRAFSPTGTITGKSSGITGTVDTGYDSNPQTDENNTSGLEFIDGFSVQELKPNSGEIIYVENRRLITRAEDQIEDIKLVIEF